MLERISTPKDIVLEDDRIDQSRVTYSTNHKRWIYSRVGYFLVFILLCCSIVAPSISAAHSLGDVTLVSHHSFLDNIGQYHIVGEVQNTGEVSITSVQVAVTLFDSSNSVIDEGYVNTEIAILIEEQKAPFHFILINSEQASQVAHYDLEVSFEVTPLIPYRQFEISSVSMFTDDLGLIIVTGDVSNTGGNTTSQVKMIGTFYNSNGNVIATGFSFTDPLHLDPGGEADFDLLLPYQVEIVDHFLLQVECSESTIIPEFTEVSVPFLIVMTLVLAFVRRYGLCGSSKKGKDSYCSLGEKS